MQLNRIQIKIKALIVGLLALTFLFGLTSVVSAATANTTINSTISSTISVASTGTVTLNVLPTGSGAQTIGSDTVTVNTNDVAGYTLTLSSSTTSTPLTSGSNTIPASAGTQASPVAQVANTWGYCVPSIGGFSTNCPSGSASSQAISGSDVFAGVPSDASPNTIATTATTATNATTTVWYAVAANTSQQSGLYTNTVTYTATAN